jgi:hypothetical protein
MFIASLLTQFRQDALRELNIASLPPNKEAAQCKQVAAQIGKHLTTARNALKTQV